MRMRKFYSMLMLAAVLPAFAAPTSNIKVSTEKVDMSYREFVRQNNIRVHKSLVTRADSENLIVTPPADADVRMYTRSTEGYSVRWGQAYKETDEGIVGEVAFCDNGDVYLKNPLSFYPTDTWIKGTKNGNNLTFTFPQLVALVPADEYDEDSEVMEVWVNVLYSEGNDSSFSFGFDDTKPNEITMTIDSDGNIKYAEELASAGYPNKMMALTNVNYAWLGYGDYNNDYTVFTEHTVTIPESLEAMDYAMTYGDNGKWVKVAFDDTNSKVYIAGIYTPDENEYEDVTGNAIVGDVFDGGASFKSRQYVGIDPYYYHAYISGGTLVDNQYLDIEDTYYMTMDSNKSKLSSASTMVVSEGQNQGYVLDVFYYPTFDAQSGYVDPNPAEPLVTGFMPYTPDYGYGGVKVQIPNTNKNGQLLHEENLSYSIIINDKQIIFDPADYPEFTEPTPWIPFNFSSYNIEIYPYEFNTRMVFMEEELAEVHTISVQSRYKDKNTYYVTNGQTYVYKLPQLAVPVFSPAGGYEFDAEGGEVTITAPAGAIVSYKVVKESDGPKDYIDAESNVVEVQITETCFIQAFSKDSKGDEETWSDPVTAIYTVNNSSVSTIAAEMGEDVEVYTIDGVRIKNDILEPGLYIIVKAGKANRVVIK